MYIKNRKHKKIENIIEAAITLFRNAHDVRKVSLEDIAVHARVSPTTIYNYFGNRDNLINEVISSLIKSTVEKSRKIVDSDLPFAQKLVAIMNTKTIMAQEMNGAIIDKMIAKDNMTTVLVDRIYDREVKPLWQIIVRQGKEEGYISQDLDEDVLIKYLDVLKAGFSARPEILQGIQGKMEMIIQMTNMMFYGFLQKKINLFSRE